MGTSMTRERAAEFGAAWNSGNADLVASFFADNGVSPAPNRSIDWWWEHKTVALVPKIAAVAESGVVVTFTSPKTDGARRCPSCPTPSGRC